MGKAAPSRNIVEGELERVLAWPELARSPQLAKFLRYIVNARLSGEDAAVKAYSIAVDVFGRPADFDPQVDPIVRVQARRLRALLELYYAGPGSDAAVRFHLPVGRYVPDFQVPDPPATSVAEQVESPPEVVESAAPASSPVPFSGSRRRSDTLLVLLFAVVVVGIIVVLSQVLQPRPVRQFVPDRPSVAISEFTVVAGADGTVLSNVGGLALELVTDLTLFEDIDSVYLTGNRTPFDRAPQFLLTGIARADGATVQVTASLRSATSDTAMWSRTVTVAAADLSDSVDDVSQLMAAQLGSHRGPLFAPAMGWLETQANLTGNETPFLCGLLFTRARDTGSLNDLDRAGDCLLALANRAPDNGAVLAMRSALLVDQLSWLAPGARDPEPMREAGRLLDRALGLEATSSLVWELYGGFLESTGRVGEAEAAFASALQLNPANTDARAAFGRMLSLRGESERGRRLANEAIAEAIAPPHWYYAAPAVNELRAGNNLLAITNAELLLRGDAELAAPIAAVAAHRQGSQVILDRFLAQVLEVTRFRQFGILPVLRERLPDQSLVDIMVEQLLAAGVSRAALTGAF